MHLCTSLTFSLLTISPFVSPAQVFWHSEPTVSSTTLVDALSADPDYTSLLRLLQRARLIPTLNRLNGSTLFAPTNDAIKRHIQSNPIWNTALETDQFALNDNVQEKLRQELFYHLLNYSLPALPAENNQQVHKTLHFPRTSVEPPSREPPPLPPWMPLPGGTLGGEPQRLRVASRDGSAWVGVDAFGKGGAGIVKGQVDAGNGVLLGISSVLYVPLDLSTVVSQHASVSYFYRVITPEIANFLNNTPELTLFLPVDPAWDALDPLERLYLESEFATDDLLRIVHMHAVVENGVKWSDTFNPAINVTTIDGTNLEIVVSPEKTMISTADLIEPDIYASNGVLHLVSSLLVPQGALQLTAEKYLLALNCTSFVSLLHSVNLTSLINDTDAKYTILAPRDDVLSIFGDGDLPEKGSDKLKKLLSYHFLPGRWTTKKLKDGMLVETALEEVGLDGGRQVLSIEVDEDAKKKGGSQKIIRFGGAGVVDDPIEVNNTVIYFLSRPLVPPSDVLQTALPILDLSSFLAAVFSTSAAELLKTTPRTTILIPHNAAFKRLGLLVSDHLLAASSKSDLQHVIMHHVIDGVEYAQALQNGSQRTFATLEGSDFQLERPLNGSVIVQASGGWTGMRSEVYLKDILTETGVVHQLSDLLIPRSVQLTVGKLMKAAKGTTMAGLVAKAGLDWVLNGTAPPDGSPWADEGLHGAGWTLLCPTDDAFEGLNLTRLYTDEEGLRGLVSQHLIPTPVVESRDVPDTINNNRPLLLADSATYTTLLSPSSAYGDVVFREVKDKGLSGYVVGIKGARGTEGKTDWARVLSWGRSTTGGGTGGVIQIDRLLVPYHPPWWVEYGGPSVVGAGGVLLIGLFFFGVRFVWRKDTTEATYEPVGGFGRDDDDE